jgi:hypothetical protein
LHQAAHDGITKSLRHKRHAICATLGYAIFRASVFSALNAIVGATSPACLSLARRLEGRRRHGRCIIVGHLMRDAAAFGARWIWTLAFGYRDDR